MFLSEQDIWERLSKGDLGIDPLPDANQLGAFAIELRLGTQFLEFPLAWRTGPPDPLAPLVSPSSPRQSRSETVPLGQSLVVSPGVTLVAATLEYVHMPLDLAGLLFPRSAWERHGLSVTGGTIDPGFRGKLALTLSNRGSVPIALYPGQRIIRLCLAQLSHASIREYSARKYSIRDAESPAEIESLKATLEEVAPQRSPDAASSQSMSKRLSEALTASATKKGKALEELVADLFTTLDGLHIVGRNPRLAAEELDLVIKNDLTTGFWRIAGSPLIVECKNWSGKVGAREISVLVDKLQALSPDARAAILVALNGITGDSYSDAMLKIREARQRGRYVLVLERKDLEQAAAGISLAHVIERKYDEMVLI